MMTCARLKECTLFVGLLALLGVSGCSGLRPPIGEGTNAIAPASATAAAPQATVAVPTQIAPADQMDQANAEPPNLWSRLRAGFGLPHPDNARVIAERDWYARHPKYLDRAFIRSEPFLYFIQQQVEVRHMPSEIALLPVVESAFQPFAYSHGRAAGLWQFIPSTGRRFGLKQNWWYDGRRDIYASTRAALDYLEQLKDQFNGDWLLALAAYNSGAGTVQAAIQRNQRLGRPTDFWHLDLPSETQAYVPKLLALGELVANPKRYDLTLPTVPDKPYFAVVQIRSQIDLARVAELSGLPLDQVYKLNPGFNRWATDPHGPHRLLLPKADAVTFLRKLAVLPEDEHVSWTRHQIRPGETLSQIARHYHTTVALLQQVNHLRGIEIRAGSHLVIPVAQESLAHYRLSADQRRLALLHTPRVGEKMVHTVRPGDTLWNIARSFGVPVHTLARWNGIAPGDVLKPGRKLVIWKRGLTTTVAYRAPAGPPARLGVVQTIRYTVRRGDSLARISQRFKVSVAQLCHWNELSARGILHPGQRLTLHVNVMRQADSI
ncbi:MAG TPA: LysM peptidoglycan-binding domain-containing protein [Gammaproteobacteria bacterium]|nr:LysM peptidoglycan-binding domain-containing protein [Gammaproteobacteria bacterium]